MSLELILTAIGLAFFIEGVAYALLPKAWIRHLIAMMEQSAAKLRVIGLTTAAFGVAIVWIAQKFI